jgi:uncharacterized protein (TIGR00369 family)
MSELSNLERLRASISGGNEGSEDSSFRYPPAIARSLGFKLVEVGPSTATIELVTDTEKHANPMGTIHGGVLCDIADAAIGTAHVTTLLEGESFTSIDLQINFFRPVWNDRIRAVAKPVNLGKTFSRYVCDIVRADGKLVAQVMSTVMTLKGEKASGR